MRRTARILAPVLLVLGLGAAACGDDASTSPATARPDAKVTGDLTVLAAASLTESFKELGTAFQAANPGAKVSFSFAASSALATQIDQGAPADVFASADMTNMDKVTATGGAGTLAPPVPFATNHLQTIVAKGNPKGISSLADLAKPGLIYVTAAPGVPIGTYAAQALAKAGVTVTPKSLEADVRSIVAKVTLGEADAGIVYATDVRAAGDKAQGVSIPDAQNIVATYPLAVLKGTKNPTAATAFAAFVTSATGQTILARYGFTKP